MIDTKITTRTLSRAISYLMHPLLIPTYAVIILLFSDSVMARLDIAVKWYFIWIVLLNTLFLPVLFILLMRVFGWINNFSLAAQKDRIVPLAMVTMCYILCAIMLSNISVAFLIHKFLFAAIACVILAMTVNFFWKISLHMISAAGLLAMLILLTVSGFANLTCSMITVIMLIGALASARLYMGCHTPSQIGVGFASGFVLTSIVILIF